MHEIVARMELSLSGFPNVTQHITKAGIRIQLDLATVSQRPVLVGQIKVDFVDNICSSKNTATDISRFIYVTTHN